MKLTILSIILLSAISGYSQNTIKQASKTFMCITEEGFNDYIVLPSKKGELHGIFLGAELGMDSVPVYFRSSFTYVKSGDSKGEITMSFTLNKYECSYKPFNAEAPNPDVISDMNKIPITLQFRMMFFGNIRQDKLELQRVTDFYDSHSDQMTFLMVTKGNQLPLPAKRVERKTPELR